MPSQDPPAVGGSTASTASQKPSAAARSAWAEYDKLADSLLHERLPRPEERVRRENAHLESELRRQRWFRTFDAVTKDLVPGTLFQYGDLADGEIRLLTLLDGRADEPLRGILFKRRLEDVRDCYEALSYCWGPAQDKAGHEILLRNLNPAPPPNQLHPRSQFRRAVADAGGNKFAIRRNLHDALVHLRARGGPVTLWVDAVCIDQTPNGREEKERQLQMMARIYNYAANVCVWLGAAFEGSRDGIQLARDIMNFQRLDQLVADPDARARWSHLAALLRCAWFARRWIIQEIALARSASLHCGDDRIHWDDFAEAVSLVLDKIDDLRGRFRDEIFDDVEATSACILVQTLSNLCRKSDDGRILAKLSDLETLVSTLLGFQATYPRDAIYSVLSLARDPPEPDEGWEALHYRYRGGRDRRRISLRANYDLSTRDLFIAFVTRCVHRSGSLDIVCRHWAPPVTDEVYGEQIKMPSWVSGLWKAPFGLTGTRKGRQNGENLVAYLPQDKRRHYRASGDTRATISMLDDPLLDAAEWATHPVATTTTTAAGAVAAATLTTTAATGGPRRWGLGRAPKPTTNIFTGEPLTQSPLQSPLPSPSAEKAEMRLPPVFEVPLPGPRVPSSSSSQARAPSPAYGGESSARGKGKEKEKEREKEKEKEKGKEKDAAGVGAGAGAGAGAGGGEGAGAGAAGVPPIHVTKPREEHQEHHPRAHFTPPNTAGEPPRRPLDDDGGNAVPHAPQSREASPAAPAPAATEATGAPAATAAPPQAAPASSPAPRSPSLSTASMAAAAAGGPADARKRFAPRRRTTKPTSIERRHGLSGILAARGFVVGTVTERSDVMRGGIVPGEWVGKMGWDESQQNRVPDVLWRLLVADRTAGGGHPPPWYKRACLHGLVDLRVTDGEGNLHSVTPPDRQISENTTKYFRRVASVIWNRRLFEAERPAAAALRPRATSVGGRGAAAPPPPGTNGVTTTTTTTNGTETGGGRGGTTFSRTTSSSSQQGDDDGNDNDDGDDDDTASRRLFGLTSKGCEVGDLVCVLHGCSVPVVLKRVKRPRTKRVVLYELVGEAYVHGIMDGEAMEDVDYLQQEGVVRDFAIV